MGTIRRFEDLECWQEARRFVRLIYEMADSNRFKKDFELVGQLKRSAISSMANIAEGFHRNSTKEFMRFLDYSRASVAETLSHCYVAMDQQYITEDEMSKLKQQADIVWKKVNNFISYLRKTNKTNRTN